MINKEKSINEIIENFNFHKVYETMNALKWTWWDSEGETPSHVALFKCATRLLHDAYDGAKKEKENYTSATGGFRAQAYVDNKTKEIFSLRLSFEVCNWEYHEEDN